MNKNVAKISNNFNKIQLITEIGKYCGHVYIFFTSAQNLISSFLF